MADNINQNIATNDVAGVHYQKIKLVDGAAGSTTAIPGDATNGLDVDVTRVIPGTGATNLGKAEDAAHTTGDVGVMALAVRSDNQTVGGGDGDYVPLLVNALGELFCRGKFATVNGFDANENVYSATILASAAGASKNHLSIYNADASLKVDILQVYVTKEITAAVTGLIRGHRLFRFTTAHSAGTVVTARKLDTAMGALAAGITVRAASTIGGAEAEALAAVGVGEEETGTSAGRQVLFDMRETNRPITLNTNEGITVQQDATAGTGVLSVGILFRVR